MYLLILFMINNKNLEDMQQQIKMHGFLLKEEFRKPMFHWRWIAEGLVFNYGKQIG